LVNSVSDYRTELDDEPLRALLVTMTAAAIDRSCVTFGVQGAEK
jgi:hypothetical protein